MTLFDLLLDAPAQRATLASYAPDDDSPDNPDDDSPDMDNGSNGGAYTDGHQLSKVEREVARESPLPPPTQDELPHTDGVPLETERHRQQIALLLNTIQPWLAERHRTTGEGSYASGNMFVYFSVTQTRKYDFRGPDVFIVLDVEPGERKSWVVWEQGKGPDIVIELLSESSRHFDKNGKKDIYQDRLRVPEYYWFDPWNADDLAGFSLCNGHYKPIAPDQRDRLPSRRLGGLCLTRWRGRFQGIDATWLRWSTPDGVLLPTEGELAERETERAERESERAERESERAERMARKLRELGIDPDSL